MHSGGKLAAELYAAAEKFRMDYAAIAKGGHSRAMVWQT
jgi:hypothetical protein